MASFFVELWESIFTPGPTPTLLLTTNITFGALQVLLLALLLATYSIHFFILSFLCGSLWYAINWFAAELKVVQAQQAEEERKKKAAQEAEALDAAAADDTDDTEVDTSTAGLAAKRAVRERRTAGSASHEVEVAEDAEGELKKRSTAATGGDEADTSAALAGTQSSVSTEDEWEKVSENENEKDK